MRLLAVTFSLLLKSVGLFPVWAWAESAHQDDEFGDDGLGAEDSNVARNNTTPVSSSSQGVTEESSNDVCGDVTCGGNGHCVVFRDRPFCQCDEEYLSAIG